ncbi:alpha/beta hydrolase [Burkholderia orbicola]|uniref:alpha/beta hydrolase n=1 Tax=Burkholderia orbicola TaxID=2978683 RepID=UPI0039A6619D
MKSEKVSFKSGGLKIVGDFYKPDGAGPFPVVVMAGGWCYVKELAQPIYAQEFVRNGMAALVFDYANMGESEGEPRQHIDPWQQIDNYHDAISYVETRDDVDASRVGVWGISYSGGHVLILAATDPRVRCAVSNVAVVNGLESMRRTHGAVRFRDLEAAILNDRRERLKTGKHGYLAMSTEDPQHEISTWPLGEVTRPFMEYKATTSPNHEHISTIASVAHLLNYNVDTYVRRIINVPVMMTIAEHDDITHWDLEQAAFNLIPNPTKKLVVFPATTHMTLYSDKSRLQVAAEAHRSWFVEHLVNAGQQAI